ncbi:hypothetical protein [Herbiconiux sp. UC225_62]|uniref:hypothetical protein n=1 Tax=Herbiconiux sp. UC225_62 TaxID=3350168 RepID=UPI0036D395B2
MTSTPPDDSTPGTPPERERPRFGEYAPTPASGSPAPTAVPPVAPTPPVPPYGSNPPAPYGAPPQAPQYTGYQSPLGSGVPGSGYPGPLLGAPPRPKTLGIIAFVAGLVALIGSPIFSGLVAQGVAPLMSYYADGTIDVSDIPADQLTAASGAFVGMFATILFCAVIGLWALVQGIVATATNRGRAFGVLAIVASVLAPIVSVIVFYAVLFAAAPALLQG